MPSPAENSEALQEASTRLHPAVLGVWAWQRVLPLAIVLLLTGLLPGTGLLLLGFLVLVLGLRYLRFRWRVDAGAVVIEEGFLFRKRRIIPRDRIQTVDLQRGIAHRLLGVVEVRIEAIGGTDTQGKLDAVAPRLAEQLRRTLLSPSARASGAAAAGDPAELPSEVEGAPPDRRPDEEVRERVGFGALVLAGLTGGRVGVVAALLGFFFQFVPETWFAGFLGEVLEEAPDPTTAAGIRLLGLLALVVLVAAFLLSVAASVAAHWRFTLSVTGGSLAVRRGLVTEHRDTVPFGRIQAVRVEENLVRRLLGLGSVRAVVAGRGAGAQADPGSGLLLPIGNQAQIYRVAREAVALEGEGVPELTPMPRRALRRRMGRALAAASVAALFGFLVAPVAQWSAWITAGAGFAGVLLPGLLLARGAYRGLGWADLGSHVAVREGVLNRRTTLVPVVRLQALETTESPFQRWNRLSTLHLRVARPLMDSTPRALDLDGAAAADRREDLTRRSRGAPSP